MPQHRPPDLFGESDHAANDGWRTPKLWPSATPSNTPPPLDHQCATCSGPAANYWTERGTQRNGGWRCLTCHAPHRPHDRIRFADEPLVDTASE